MMHLPEYAARAVERLEQAGFEAWAVGGCVRDSLRGVRPHDWDLCTAAAPEEMLRVFEGEQVIKTGLKHGTLNHDLPHGRRLFGRPSPGRRALCAQHP